MIPRLVWLAPLFCLVPAAAPAVLHTHDARPAATLLLPYFEIDAIPNFPESDTVELVAVPKTVFTVGNATPAPVLARVTLWTDFGIPTLSFHLALTGYDIETIDLKQTFDGIVPQSIGGAPSCPAALGMRLPPDDIIALRNAHTGQPSMLLGNLCGSMDHGDGRPRGFVTVDVVTACDDTLLPNEPGYSAILGTQNALWGSWEVFEPSQNASDAGTLVHLESGPVAADDHTFYGRFNGFNGSDGREALGNVWAARFSNGGAFDGGTALRVWREPRAVPTPVPCPVGALPASQPGDADTIVAFDERENPVLLNVPQPALPLVTQRVQVNGPALPVPYDFGWLLLDLNSAQGTTKAELKQSYVSVVSTALGRFAAGTDATRMGHPTTAVQPNPIISAPLLFTVEASKTVSGGPPFLVGQDITYTITVTRAGPGGERDCTLMDVLPVSLALVSANASSGTAVANLMTNTVTWSGHLDDTTPMATIGIVATITSAGGVLNQAFVAVDTDGDGVPEDSVNASRFFTASTP